MKKILIAAVGKNMELAKDDQLPWHLPKDLQFFRSQIRGQTVVMGRKTFEAMGKPSKNRSYVVITRNDSWNNEHAQVVHSLEEAYAWCESAGVENCIVLGGGEIYRLAMATADELLMTFIDGEFEANVFFPTIDRSEWQEIWREDHYKDAEHAYNFSFVRLERK